MNDEKYTLYEDTAEKAKITQSARKFVSKPTERTTAECTEYAEANYKQLIPWKKLKALPKGMQKEWIERHIEHWNVGSTTIAQAMGISLGTFSGHTSSLGIKMRKHYDKRAAKLYLEAMGVLKPEEPVEPTPAAPELHENPSGKMKATRQHIVLEGEFDAQAVAAALKYAWQAGDLVKIEIFIKESEPGEEPFAQ